MNIENIFLLIPEGIKHYLVLSSQVLLMLFLGVSFAKWVTRRLKDTLSQARHVDETLTVFLTNFIYYSFITMTVVACLGKLGVHTSSLIAALSAAGLAVGLALQGTLSNIASGIMILMLRPFKIGEYIEVGSTKGTVESIGLFATQLKDLDGLFLMAPNIQLWNQTIKNYSRNNIRRIVVPVGISYKDDIEKAQKIAISCLREIDFVLKDPGPQVYVYLLGDSSVNLQIRCWVGREGFIAKKSDLIQKIKASFDENEISIPFPQREITLLQQV